MHEHATDTGSTVIPTVRYRDVPKAIAWLERAFGFEPHRLVRDGEGAPLYGELSFGSGMVMVAPIQDSPFGKLMVQPDEIGGAETQICYLLVDDITAHYARAKAAGAEILFDIDAESDSNGYSCRDVEGHVWNIGTYDPWAIEAPAADDADEAPTPRKRRALAACLALLIASATLVYFYNPLWDGQASLNVMSAIDAAQAKPDQPPAHTEEASVRADELLNEKLARIAAEQQLNQLREQLAEERRAREAAEASAAQHVHQVRATPPGPSAVVDSDELAAARAALRVALNRAAEAERAKDAALRAAEEARGEFATLRAAKVRAEQSARQVRTLAMTERRRRIAAERTLRIAKTSPYTPFPVDKNKP